jgi:ribosome-associated heat shock protein Hsp15
MTESGGSDTRIRIDKWIWQARLVKTRSLAAALVSAGRTRVNGQRIDKPGRLIGPGDVLTLPLGPQVRLLRVLAVGTRRGPAPEAASLYAELHPQPVPGRYDPLE